MAMCLLISLYLLTAICCLIILVYLTVLFNLHRPCVVDRSMCLGSLYIMRMMNLICVSGSFRVIFELVPRRLC